nr:uncharacterized protein LOC119173723 [Rhipicephalus microplus]
MAVPQTDPTSRSAHAPVFRSCPAAILVVVNRSTRLQRLRSGRRFFSTAPELRGRLSDFTSKKKSSFTRELQVRVVGGRHRLENCILALRVMLCHGICITQPQQSRVDLQNKLPEPILWKGAHCQVH